MDDEITQSTSNSIIPFHKHCQQTVCSAYGFEGNGATWKTIRDSIGIPSAWKEAFKENHNNITQDIRTILEIVNTVHAELSNRMTLQENIFGERNDSDQTIGFNRRVNLSVGGQVAVSFNPFYDDSFNDILDFPLKSVQFLHGGKFVGTIQAVAPDTQRVEIPLENSNVFNVVDTSSSNRITEDTHVFKTEVQSGSADIVPRFFLSESYSGNLAKPVVVEWEWQVENMTHQDAQVLFEDLTISNLYGRTLQVLENEEGQSESRRTISAGQVKIYRFRLDLSEQNWATLGWTCIMSYTKLATDIAI